MNRAIPDALVEPPRKLIRAMPVNRKDRHVLAVAVHVGAPTLVTNNVRDFPPEACDPYGIEATNADNFALAQVDLDVGTVIESIAAMAKRRSRYPKEPREIVDVLNDQLPKAMEQF